MQRPMWPRYLCGFFFWLDAGSTVTLILDLTYAGAKDPGAFLARLGTNKYKHRCI